MKQQKLLTHFVLWFSTIYMYEGRERGIIELKLKGDDYIGYGTDTTLISSHCKVIQLKGLLSDEIE